MPIVFRDKKSPFFVETGFFLGYSGLCKLSWYSLITLAQILILISAKLSLSLNMGVSSLELK